MFDQLYTYPATVARHRSGPLLEERLAFLAHLADQGYARKGLGRVNELVTETAIAGKHDL